MEAAAGVSLGGVTRPSRLRRLASDERLVALARAGDARAFEALYDRHHRAILAFCRHMLGSREEAEDAVQHTFLAAYRDLVASDKPIQPRPWLFAIARNRCLSTLRARRLHVPLDAAEPSTDGLAAHVERREDVRELLGDLARLPDEQRAALLLSELGALDHEGIATALGCRREKVKALVFQARSSLAASREARAVPCAEIRVELATASGGDLRKGVLRRHLRDCAGCRAFKSEVGRQRQLLGIALPVLPTAALKSGALAGIGGAGTAGGATAAAATGGGLAALGGGTAAKLAVGLTLAGSVAGGGAVALDAVREPGSSSPAPAANGAPTAPPAAVPLVPGAIPSPRSRIQAAPGSTPAQAVARGRARGRGIAPPGLLPNGDPPGRGQLREGAGAPRAHPPQAGGGGKSAAARGERAPAVAPAERAPQADERRPDSPGKPAAKPDPEPPAAPSATTPAPAKGKPAPSSDE
jgi:RNA polymerase sigma factor (sigma-70 family)